MAENTGNDGKKTRSAGQRILHGIVMVISLFFAVILIAADLNAAVVLLPALEHEITAEGTAAENTGKEKSSITPEEWMASIPDNVNLAYINLPGTHDAGTKYISLPLILKCQDSTVEEQLKSGYRYLDIRLGSETIDGVRRLVITHGDFTCQYSRFSRQYLTLDSVLKECYSFLKEHPTETIVLNVKQEVEDISLEEMQTILKKMTDANPDYWYLDSSLPVLGKARGKIILCRRYEDEAGLGEEAGVPLIWEEQDNSCDPKNPASYSQEEENSNTVLYVQDRYCYSSQDKWNAFIKTIEDQPAASGTSASKKNYRVTLNFLSTKGILPVGNPYYFASQLNRKFMNYIPTAGQKEKENLGWVVVDFGSEDLAESIYMTNFKE